MKRETRFPGLRLAAAPGPAGHARLTATPLLLTLMLSIACHKGELGGTTASASRRNEPQPIERKECTRGSAQTVDVNNDGRADITHRVDDGKRRCSEVDLNFDGRPDLVRFYGDDGKTVSFEQHDYDFDGNIDDNNFYVAGQVERKELDTNFDRLVDTWLWCKGPLIQKAERARRKPDRVDTWEKYEDGVLAEVQYDENNDGNVDKWDTYNRGALHETRVDTDGDGKSDRIDPAESGADEADPRISCDGSALPPEKPMATGGAFDAAGEAAPAAEGTPRALLDAGSTVVVRDAGALAPVVPVIANEGPADAGVATDSVKGDAGR